ncbi:MAG: type II toxin-antitoxin system RatA family toxin [Salaquimonas sp.]
MPSFEKRHPVNHSAKNMFDLVADVECYPEFLPLCEGLTVKSKRQKGNKTLLVADMTVGYKAIRETFSSQVMLDPDAQQINVKYINGPFKYLDNRWMFETSGEGSCTVVFFIDYEFKSKMLGLLMGSMFETAFKRFTKAFEERADEIYKKDDLVG